MSRGLGSAERAVLKVLEEHRDMRLDVVACLTGLHPESIRRAFRTLAAKGMVELGRDNGWRLHDEGWVKFWKTTCPTAKLSADESSALSPETRQAS